MTNHATLALIPDPGEPDQWHVPAPVNGGWLADITAWADTIPGWSWAAALTTLTLFTVISLPWARAQAYKAGRRTAGTTTDTKGRALFIAAMVPAAFFWLAVLAGSFRGLAAFGRDTLHWADGWEYLVPLTLDGIAISFGFLAFRAVRSHRSPDRAVHVATGAAVASALINYAHEVSVGGSWVGGGYLALLSILGLLIFHEFLDQFTEGTAYIQRVNPKFGLRWLTWPSNTVCAWIAWRNYPPLPLPSNPTDGQKRWWGSINHAVAHLNTVRRAKRIARHTVDLNQKRHTIHPLLATIPPVRQLVATLTAQSAEMAEMSARLDQVAAGYEAEKLRAAAAENRAETERQRADNAVDAQTIAEAETVEAHRRAEKLRGEMEAEMTRLRAETTNTIHRTESIADRRVTTAQAEKDQALARIDQLEQQWIEAKQEAAVSAERLSAAQTETVSALRSAEQAEKEAASLRSTLTQVAEKHTAELAETTARFRVEMAENEARLRAEMSTVNLSTWRSESRSGERRKPTTGQRGKPAENRSGASNQPRMSDGEAVQALLRAHPEPDYEWKQTEVQAITGAGFGRIPRLISAVAEHHRAAVAENHSGIARSADAERSGDATSPETTPIGEDTEIARTPATVAAG